MMMNDDDDDDDDTLRYSVLAGAVGVVWLLWYYF